MYSDPLGGHYDPQIISKKKIIMIDNDELSCSLIDIYFIFFWDRVAINPKKGGKPIPPREGFVCM